MKVLLSWLREFVSIELDTPTLCEKLSLGGLEVDDCEELGADLRGVIIGEILSTAPHPQADRLTVCEVRTGPGPTASVVCGATNMKAGDRVAYAAPGATLPGGRRIEPAVIRGLASAGMLCSEAELALGEASEGILVLGPEAPLGQRIGVYFGIEDTLLDLSVTPNRGDCLSILGVAREIAALTGARMLRTRNAVCERGAPAREAVAVRIEDALACPRYAARVVHGVRIGPSPPWVRRRLEAVGLRAINNVVDVTNLVMVERGQPLHAFDYDRLPGHEIVVRRAGGTPGLRTLDGEERVLAADDILVTTGDAPIALAGVMGGADSEVTGATVTVLLEAACFDPASVRRTGRRLDLRSESSYRFERGIDIEAIPAALDRAAVLLKQLAGGDAAPGIVEAYPGAQPPAAIHLRPKRVEELLGVSLTRGEIIAALKAVGASVSGAPHGALLVTPASYRTDVKREIDVVEEVARVIGYSRIVATMPEVRLEGGQMPARLEWERELKRVLLALGFCEAVCVSFASSQTNGRFPGLATEGRAVELANPLNRDEPELRRSLLGGLVDAWRHNRNQGAPGAALVAVGRVFWETDAPREAWRLAGILAGELPRRGLGGARTAEFADAKGAVEVLLERLGADARATWERCTSLPFHPGAAAWVRCEREVVGVVGGLHPELEFELGLDGACWVFELDIEKVLPYGPAQRVFTGLPRYPAVARDVAVVVDEDFASDRVVQFLRQWRPELVEQVALFDAYRGAPIAPGKKSLAYSIAYRAADRTLTDDEVNALHAELVAALRRQLGVDLRQ